MRITPLFLLAIISAANCSAQKQLTLKKAEWLIGTWENKTTRGSIYETWKKIHRDTFSGKSYALKDKDTVIFETIRMVQENTGVFYVPVVQNQNNGLPVQFKAKPVYKDELIFENPDHDFPQVISYKKIKADSLVAEISGVINNQKRSQIFPMKRKSKN